MTCLSILSLVVALVVCVSHCTITGVSLTESLERADQQLDRLTQRVVNLSDRLEAILGSIPQEQFHLERLSRKLDRSEGTVYTVIGLYLVVFNVLLCTGVYLQIKTVQY